MGHLLLHWHLLVPDVPHNMQVFTSIDFKITACRHFRLKSLFHFMVKYFSNTILCLV